MNTILFCALVLVFAVLPLLVMGCILISGRPMPKPRKTDWRKAEKMRLAVGRTIRREK